MHSPKAGQQASNRERERESWKRVYDRVRVK